MPVSVFGWTPPSYVLEYLRRGNGVPASLSADDQRVLSEYLENMLRQIERQALQIGQAAGVPLRGWDKENNDKDDDEGEEDPLEEVFEWIISSIRLRHIWGGQTPVEKNPVKAISTSE
jgi:hypothetical protein